MQTAQQQSIIYSVLAATIVCTLFLGFNYLQAQWSGAPSNPPSGNIAAPIHTGGGNQMSAAGPVPVGGDTPDRISTGQFLASDRMLSDRYCDVRGENCFGSEDVYDTLSLNGTGARFNYQRVGGPVGQTAEHVLPPPSGGRWDFCVVSGNRRFQAENIHSSDYDIAPDEWGQRHPDTTYRSADGGASCSVFWGGGDMRDYSGSQLPGNEWTILLAETDPDIVARCIATCFKRELE